MMAGKLNIKLIRTPSDIIMKQFENDQDIDPDKIWEKDYLKHQNN